MIPPIPAAYAQGSVSSCMPGQRSLVTGKPDRVNGYLTPVYDQATVEALLTELDAMTELLRSIANPHSVGEAFANAVKVRKAMGIAATHSADEGEI